VNAVKPGLIDAPVACDVVNGDEQVDRPFVMASPVDRKE